MNNYNLFAERKKTFKKEREEIQEIQNKQFRDSSSLLHEKQTAFDEKSKPFLTEMFFSILKSNVFIIDNSKIFSSISSLANPYEKSNAPISINLILKNEDPFVFFARNKLGQESLSADELEAMGSSKLEDLVESFCKETTKEEVERSFLLFHLNSDAYFSHETDNVVIYSYLNSVLIESIDQNHIFSFIKKEKILLDFQQQLKVIQRIEDFLIKQKEILDYCGLPSLFDDKGLPNNE
jgi:hypothetical protein